MKIKDILTSKEKNVKKIIFTSEANDAVVECVLYKYPDYKTRTTICISTQCGCKVGCVFCGTGKKFIRNLTSAEIVSQVNLAFQNEAEYKDILNSDKLQIMFMSMGEPSHNADNVIEAIKQLGAKYPTAQLLISTIGTKGANWDKLLDFLINTKLDVGLQFSIHHYNNSKRDKLIPYENKMSLAEISMYGEYFYKKTGKQAYCNYVVTPDNNKNYTTLFNYFPSEYFAFTFSVLCNKNENMKEVFEYNKDNIKDIHDDFLNSGYNVRVFDPAGQDDIGGGCGQLFHFQNFIKNKK